MEHKCKIILDRNLKTDLNYTIYKQGKIYIFHDENLNSPNTNNITHIKTPVIEGKLDPQFILNEIY